MNKELHCSCRFQDNVDAEYVTSEENTPCYEVNPEKDNVVVGLEEDRVPADVVVKIAAE